MFSMFFLVKSTYLYKKKEKGRRKKSHQIQASLFKLEQSALIILERREKEGKNEKENGERRKKGRRKREEERKWRMREIAFLTMRGFAL